MSRSCFKTSKNIYPQFYEYKCFWYYLSTHIHIHIAYNLSLNGYLSFVVGEKRWKQKERRAFGHRLFSGKSSVVVAERGQELHNLSPRPPPDP